MQEEGEKEANGAFCKVVKLRMRNVILMKLMAKRKRSKKEETNDTQFRKCGWQEEQ